MPILPIMLPDPPVRVEDVGVPDINWFLRLSHVVAIERPGPSPTGEYYTMSGDVISAWMYPTHHWFEWAKKEDKTTIGIGDGGNEIGMGKIPLEIIAKNIPNGGLIACRVPTDCNIVCGVSNWGAYGLAAGVWYLRGMRFDAELFNPEHERRLWEKVLKEAVLVDGITGQRTLTVDGLSWDDYIRPFQEIAKILEANCPR